MKGGCTSSRKNHPLAARIKRLMQKDEEVGRIASVTPILISKTTPRALLREKTCQAGRALELFLRKLCTNVIEYTKSKKSRTLSPSHLKAYVFSDSNMDFLRGTVKDAPDMPAQETATAASPAKRNRAPQGESALTASRTRGRGKGESCPGRNSKRQCVPKAASDPPLPIVSSAFSALSQRGPEGASMLNPNGTWKATSVHSAPVFRLESSSMHSLDTGSVSTLPHLSHDSQIVPNSISVDFQKSLEQLPTSVATLPPVSTTISISNIELGLHAKEGQTPTSGRDLSPAKQFSSALGVPSVPSLKAEEDNYDFSDDDMEHEEEQCGGVNEVDSTRACTTEMSFL